MSYSNHNLVFLLLLLAIAGCGGDVGFDVSVSDAPIRPLPEDASKIHFAKNPGVRNPNSFRLLIKAKKISKDDFLGINLNKLGKGPYLSTFKAIPSEGSIIDEITANRDKVEAYTHSLIGIYFDEIDIPHAARRHYELAIQGAPEEARLRINLGMTYAREGNLDAACKHWEEAAKIDGKLDVLHYNIACFHASREDVDSAAQELRLAIQHGFRDVGVLVRDPEFATVIRNPKIQTIVEEIRVLLRK